jgi:hypothetical protein
MIIPMMIEIESDDSNSIDEYSRPSYLSNRPLVEDEYRQYIFFLSDDDAVDSEIETMYGPFPDSVEVSCPSPRPILQAKQSMFNKQKEIERLNRRIEELEAKKAADIRRLRAKEDDEPSRQVASTKVSRQQNDSSLLESTCEIAAERKIIDDQVKETDAMCRALEEKIAIQKNQIAMAVKESTENALKLQPMDSSLPKTEFSKPIHSSDIITIDSDSDMEVNDESSNKEDSSDNTNTIKNDVPFITEDALVEADPSRKADIEESKLLDAEIKDLQSLLVKVEEERNVHRLKLLGLKVKISINKNRKETAKNTPNQQPASPNPVLGTKRKQFMNYVPPPKRRPQMEPYSNVPPPPPQPFQHQIPPFYQQINPIPPPLPVLPHFGPPMTNYYHPLPHVDMTLTAPSTFYPLPLPPPPPPTGLPPPPSPPPPPPPEIEEIVSLPPPKSIHADIPRNRRETPYAGLNDSTATHAEDFENMSSILRDVEQLVSVRIFKVDDQTNAVAIEDRSLPRPCRLVSFNGYTMPMRTLLLEEVC